MFCSREMNLGQAARHLHGAQRDDERHQAQRGHQYAVEHAHCHRDDRRRAHGGHGQERRVGRQQLLAVRPEVEHVGAGDHRKGDRRAHGQVDAPGDDDQRRADGGHGHHADVLEHQLGVGVGEKAFAGGRQHREEPVHDHQRRQPPRDVDEAPPPPLGGCGVAPVGGHGRRGGRWGCLGAWGLDSRLRRAVFKEDSKGGQREGPK